MSLVNPSQSNAGETIEASDINNPINQLAAVINGNIDSTNIAAAGVGNTQLANKAITGPKIDFGGAGSGVWWEEIGRTTLTVVGDAISVSSLPARKYLHVVVNLANSGAIDAFMRFNNDATATYAHRSSTNGSADTSTASTLSIPIDAGSYPVHAILSIMNVPTLEKIVYIQTIAFNVSGAANIPGRTERSGKWSYTAGSITRIDVLNAGAGDFAIGSEVIVLGHD